MAQPQTKPELPEGTYSVSKEDKEEIRKFGRELNKFIQDYARKNAKGPGMFPFKIIVGGLDYVVQIHQQRASVVRDDYLCSLDEFENKNLFDLLIEPFAEEPEIKVEESAPADSIPSPVNLADGPEEASV